MDAHKNLAYTTVSAPPSPASSGTGLEVVSGTAALLPTPPFNVTLWPAGEVAVRSNAEIARVTNIVGDLLSITRAQEGTSAVSVVAGFQLGATITDKTLTDLEDALSALSQAVSVVSAARVAGDDALSDKVSVLSQAVSALSQRHSATSNALSVETAARIAKDDTLSQGVSVLSQQVSALSQLHSALSQAHSVLSALNAGVSARAPGNLSVKGLQSALNALSNQISDALSAGNVASNQASVLSQQVSVLSQLHSALSQDHSALSQRVSALSGVVSTVSVAVTSVDTRVNTVSNGVSVISQAVSVLSQAVSVISQQMSVISAQTRLTALTADVNVSVSTLTNIPGLSVSVEAGVRYRFEAMIPFTHGGAVARFGLTFPAMKVIRGRLLVPLSPNGANRSWGGDSASGSVLISEGTASLAASALVHFAGVMVVSTAGVVHMQAGGSATVSAVTVKEGAYLAVFKLN